LRAQAIDVIQKGKETLGNIRKDFKNGVSTHRPAPMQNKTTHRYPRGKLDLNVEDVEGGLDMHPVLGVANAASPT